jgi:hypothetical protein
VLRSFLGTVKIKASDSELTLGVDPDDGRADSGDLESDLKDLLLAARCLRSQRLEEPASGSDAPSDRYASLRRNSTGENSTLGLSSGLSESHRWPACGMLQ